jgi:hypothetical protein
MSEKAGTDMMIEEDDDDDERRGIELKRIAIWMRGRGRRGGG